MEITVYIIIDIMNFYCQRPWQSKLSPKLCGTKLGAGSRDIRRWTFLPSLGTFHEGLVPVQSKAGMMEGVICVISSSSESEADETAANVGESACHQSIGYRPVAPGHTMTTIAAMDLQTRDPLIRLPYETWLQCLSLATRDSADGPLLYLAVSTHWSVTILNSPALWTYIVINNGEDEEARLHTFLHLSASQLLDVVCAEDIPVQSLQLLAQIRMRLRSLVVNRPIDEYGSMTIPILLWGSSGNPNMRRLAVRPWRSIDSIAHALIPACPNLRSLESSDFIEESMIASTLEEVSVWIRTLADLGPLYKCTHLRSLTLMRAIPKSKPEPEVRHHFLQLSSHLGLHLANLEMRFSLEEFIVFVPYIPSFVTLYSAAFNVFMPAKELTSRITTPFPIQGTSNLRVFSLTLHSLQLLEELPAHRDMLGHILDYFSQNQLLQDLHTFRCNIYIIPVEAVRIASLLCAFPNARILDLIFEPYETDMGFNHPPIYMPNLLELYLSPIAWLAYIEAPNLLHLRRPAFPPEDRYATPHLLEHFGTNISHLVVDGTISKAISKAYSESVGPKFESLRTIHITDSSNTEWVCHLSSIRIIDFTKSPNFFFLDLLRFPGALPNLSVIKTCSFPSWELLFEVLRRRNVAQMHRLQEFVFPNFPVLTILSRLVKLLQGHTDVYTNRDIDEVIYKRRMDRSLYV